MNKTFILNSKHIKRKWYKIDCKNENLGRIASLCSIILSGKLKPSYHPALDIGDYVILTNIKDLIVDKQFNKFHVYAPGRPGKSYKHLKNAPPELIIQQCIYGMLSNGTVKRHLNKRLKLYQSINHSHAAQNPIKLDIFKI